MNQNIDALNKTIKGQALQINTIKAKDAEIENLKNQIKKYSFDKESLTKTINTLKTESQKKNMGNLQEQNMQKSEHIIKLQMEIDKLKSELK